MSRTATSTWVRVCLGHLGHLKLRWFITHNTFPNPVWSLFSQMKLPLWAGNWQPPFSSILDETKKFGLRSSSVHFEWDAFFWAHFFFSADRWDELLKSKRLARSSRKPGRRERLGPCDPLGPWAVLWDVKWSSVWSHFMTSPNGLWIFNGYFDITRGYIMVYPLTSLFFGSLNPYNEWVKDSHTNHDQFFIPLILRVHLGPMFDPYIYRSYSTHQFKWRTKKHPPHVWS
jgi:hypothetical protein